MQPYDVEWAKTELIAQSNPIEIGGQFYKLDMQSGVVVETGENISRYPIQYVLGGKYVYYFLTPALNGRLQTLPLGYDVKNRQWFDVTQSGLHISRDVPAETGLDWKAWPFTFNTSCYRCHVSQGEHFYSPDANVYDLKWVEPGINCETCHGPAKKHIQAAHEVNLNERHLLKDPLIIRTGSLPSSRLNDLCLSCHIKADPLTGGFMPGDALLDHFAPVLLDHPDFFPDGRDLGENYTYLSWELNSCAEKGDLNCLHCHTSSGRYRYHEQDANKACLPCHQDTVRDSPSHTHHDQESTASLCISCHMPKTRFAHMDRTDHSMRAPIPAATLAFGSPNACNICHKDKDAEWANKVAISWYGADYQNMELYRAGLVSSARVQDWDRLPEIVDYLHGSENNAVYIASILKMLPTSIDEKILSGVIATTENPSPLVRAAAADLLGQIRSRKVLSPLIRALGDSSRLTRTRAVPALADFSGYMNSQQKKRYEQFVDEYLETLKARPDHWASYYNLGNFLMKRGRISEAVDQYQMSVRFEPVSMMALVNLSMAYARLENPDKAFEYLDLALQESPENPAVLFNMGLLLVELGREKEAVQMFLRALAADPGMAESAHNLCILIAPESPVGALDWCSRAYELRPSEDRFAFTYAFYLNQAGEPDEAVEFLNNHLASFPAHLKSRTLLYQILDGHSR